MTSMVLTFLQYYYILSSIFKTFFKTFRPMSSALNQLPDSGSSMVEIQPLIEGDSLLRAVRNSRLVRFLAMAGLVTSLGGGMVGLSGCEDDPAPHRDVPGGTLRRAPTDPQTPLRKEGEAVTATPKEGSTSGGCNEAGSNALGVMLGIAAAVSLIVRAAPGKSWPERLGSGGVAVTGAAVGAFAMCGGAEPTLILSGATAANSLLALAAAIPPSESK